MYISKLYESITPRFNEEEWQRHNLIQNYKLLYRNIQFWVSRIFSLFVLFLLHLIILNGNQFGNGSIKPIFHSYFHINFYLVLCFYANKQKAMNSIDWSDRMFIVFFCSFFLHSKCSEGHERFVSIKTIAIIYVCVIFDAFCASRTICIIPFIFQQSVLLIRRKQCIQCWCIQTNLNKILWKSSIFE